MLLGFNSIFISKSLFIFHKGVKVADFGVARFQNQGGVMTAETGTYRWMAPEVCMYFVCNVHLPFCIFEP